MKNRKYYIGFSLVLILILFLLLIKPKLIGVNSNENANSEWTVYKEIMQDMNSDKKEERIVLLSNDETKEFESDFGRVQIFSDKKLVFDSGKNKNFFGILKDSTIEDKNKNGVSEFIIREFGFASGPDGLVIIEYDKNSRKFFITFSDNLDNYGFDDFDGDGVFELYGLTATAAANPPFFDREDTAYKLINNKYLKSYNATRLMIIKDQKNAKENYYKNPTTDYAFFNLLLLNAKLALTDEAEQLINKYKEIGGEMPKEQLIELFNSKLSSYKEEWWVQLKKESCD